MSKLVNKRKMPQGCNPGKALLSDQRDFTPHILNSGRHQQRAFGTAALALTGIAKEMQAKQQRMPGHHDLES